MGEWNGGLARLWTYNVPPSRPSVAEMSYYADWLARYRERVHRRLCVLVLGSTPEFRDWAYEEYAQVTVVDQSEEYHQTISREMRHKEYHETLVVSRWEDMSFDEQFDLVIGDLALGNVAPSRFDEFVRRVAKALVPSGLFMGKSFIWDEAAKDESPEAIIEDYEAGGKGIHPYTFINHRLGFCCLDKESRTIGFSNMYKCLVEMRAKGVVSDEVMGVFDELGWSEEMIATFYAPSKQELLDAVEPYFLLREYGKVEQVYSSLFPTYVFERK